jgi:hypothetical protein
LPDPSTKVLPLMPIENAPDDELTVTVAEASAEPPLPVHVSVYVVVAVGDTDCVPLVVCDPLQPPLAVHPLAFVLDQVSVELAPNVIELGLAVSVTVGAGVAAVTVTVAEALPEPPGPVHVSV